jgi:hypothetical protein
MFVYKHLTTTHDACVPVAGGTESNDLESIEFMDLSRLSGGTIELVYAAFNSPHDLRAGRSIAADR